MIAPGISGILKLVPKVIDKPRRICNGFERRTLSGLSQAGDPFTFMTGVGADYFDRFYFCIVRHFQKQHPGFSGGSRVRQGRDDGDVECDRRSDHTGDVQLHGDRDGDGEVDGGDGIHDPVSAGQPAERNADLLSLRVSRPGELGDGADQRVEPVRPPGAIGLRDHV